tara:strand:- start:975 stop:1298 length:324 start_codon:yes stop_codon:yes gene_type:complete
MYKLDNHHPPDTRKTATIQTMTVSILSIYAILLASAVLCICIAKILIVTHDDYDEEQDDLAISGREGDGRARNEPYHQPYTYYLGTNKNKTYKKQKRSRWKEEWDFN